MTKLYALIRRMADELDSFNHPFPHPLAAEARAALAEPNPEGPTVMEIIELADEIEAAELGQVDLVRAALDRWGRPTPPPPNDLSHLSEAEFQSLAPQGYHGVGDEAAND